MDIRLSKEQKMIQKSFHDFAENVIRPYVPEMEEKCYIPQEIIDGLAELGAFGIAYPEEVGGAGAGFIGYALMIEELARVSAGVAVMLLGHIGALNAVYGLGDMDIETKRKLMEPGTSGEQIWSFAFTEPQTGSDAAQLKTTARKEGDNWVINGTKRFITNPAFRNGPCLIIAFIEGTQQLGVFYVDKSLPGYSTSAPWEKIGQHGGPLEDCYFDNVVVPEWCMINGTLPFAAFKRGVTFGKVGVCSQAVGLARAAYEEAFNYTTQKMHRGTPIAAKYQVTQTRLASCYEKYVVSRTMTRRLALLCDAVNADPNYENELEGGLLTAGALTKNYVTEACFEAARDAQLLHGCYGSITDYDITRILRDVSMNATMEGQQDIQLVQIAHSLLEDVLIEAKANAKKAK